MVMKKLLLSFLLCCFTAIIIHAQNLISNGGFNTWTINSPLTNMPSSWARVAGTVGTHYLNESDPAQGNVLRLTDQSSPAAKRFYSTSTINIPDAGIYRISFKVKGTLGIRAITLFQGDPATSASGTTASATNHVLLINNRTTQNAWTTLVYNLTVNSPTPGNYYFFIHWSTSSGTPVPTCNFLIDDISVSKKTFYRSKANGSYATAANWDNSTDSLNWVVATSRPINTEYSVVDIMPSHTMTVYSPQSAVSLNINPGGRLTIAAKTETNDPSLTTADLTIRSSATGVGTLINNNTLTVTGTSIVQQYLANVRNWYISSPVSGAVAPAGYTYYQRDEAGASWTSQPFVVGNTFTPGKGYIALPDAAGSTISFSGTINNGEISIPLTWAGATSKGFNLIGNPYPSHLTWTQAFAEATTAPDGGVAPATLIEPSIYVRTNAGTTNGSGQWSFQTYNASTGLAVPSQALLSGGIIPPMQAFWVKAKQAGNLILTSDLTKSHQTGNPLKAPAVQTTDRQLIRLEVSNGTRTDETLLFFDANAENGYDRYDSPKFAEADTELQLFTTIANEKLVMNGLKTMPLNQEIALGFVPGSATSFSIKANQLTNLPSDVQVILKDNANDGVETNLTDGESVYNFTTTESSGNRFSLILRAPDVSTNVENTGKLYTRVITNASGQIEIHAPANSSYAVFNAMGQKVSFGSTSSEVHALHLNLSSGMYVVKVNDITGKVIIK